MEQLRPNPVTPIHVINSEPLQTIIPPIEQPAESHTKEFSLGEMKEEPGKIKINFFAGDNPNEFVKAPTEAARPTEPGSATNYINPAQSTGTSNPLNPQKTKEEIRGSMNVLISILDYIMSFIGFKLSGEGTMSMYTADATSKKILADALTDFFYEKQIKMSPALTLLLAFLSAYGLMLLKAGKTKFEKKKNSPPAKEKDKFPNWTSEGQKPETKQINKEPVIIEKFEKYVAPAPTKSFAWMSPDPKIIASSNKDVDDYVHRGVYPMYIKSKTSGKQRKVKYDPSTGRPIHVGKPARL